MMNRRKLWSWLFAAALATAGVATPAVAQAQAPIETGTLERLSGTVVIGSGGATRVARQGERLLVGEILTTEAGAEALVKFRDDSSMALRPLTQVVITDFRDEDKGNESFVASLLRGTLRSVSGLIGKARPRGVVFRTPTATVGIRGTDFELALVPEGERDRAGVYNFVHDGSTNLQIASGDSLDVQVDQTGFAPDNPQPGEPALVLLRERPAFLRGGGFDAMLLQSGRPPLQIFMPRMR
jgi:FecR protein